MGTLSIINTKATIIDYTVLMHYYNLYLFCCHTYPNDKLLQLLIPRYAEQHIQVIIPIQTISFYNKEKHICFVTV